MVENSKAYQTPTILDFQRNLDAIIHDVEQEAEKAKRRIMAELAAKGLAMSGAAIRGIIENADEIHRGILERCMNLIDAFTKAPSQILRKSLADATRARLESLAGMLLKNVPDAGSPPVAQQVRTQYAAVFQQRLDRALKDIEIGFINGRRITSQDEAEAPTLGKAVILKPTFMGMGIDVPKAWQWVRSLFQHRNRQ